MTLAQIKTRVGDIINTTVSDSTLTNWINDSLYRAIGDADWEFMHATATATLTTANDYTISTAFSVSDLDKVLSVRDITNDQEYTFVPYEQYDDMLARGGYEYTISPDSATLSLARVSSGATVQMDYYKTITELSASADTPPFNVKFQQLLVWGAIAQYYRSIEEIPEAVHYEGLFNNMRVDMFSYYKERTSGDLQEMQSPVKNYKVDF